MKTGKISVVKPGINPNSKGLMTALIKEGMTRFPGTSYILSPYKELDGSYRTGLDENANYISKMSPEEAEQERAIVRGLAEKAKAFYGNIDLSSRAPFWSKAIAKWGDEDVAPTASLKDGDNVFDFSVPQQLIAYAYLRVHPLVAPSGSAVLSGRYPRCKYYVNDFDVEAAQEFKNNSKIAKALKELEELTPTQRKMVSRQLGFSFTDEALEEVVYNRLMDYIMESKKAGKSSNLTIFNTYASMDNTNLVIRDTVKQGLMYNIYRKSKGGIFRGELKVAVNEDELINYLSDPQNQDERTSVENELKMKKTINA